MTLPLLVRDRARGAGGRIASGPMWCLSGSPTQKAGPTRSSATRPEDPTMPLRPERIGRRTFRDSFKGLSRRALRAAGANPARGACLGSSTDERGTSNPEDAGSIPARGARNARLGGAMTAPATAVVMMRTGLPQPEASVRGAEAMATSRTVQAGRASRFYLEDQCH